MDVKIAERIRDYEIYQINCPPLVHNVRAPFLAQLSLPRFWDRRPNKFTQCAQALRRVLVTVRHR